MKVHINRWGASMARMNTNRWSDRHLGYAFNDFDMDCMHFGEGGGYLTHTASGRQQVTQAEQQELSTKTGKIRQHLMMLDSNDCPAELMREIDLFSRAICNAQFIVSFADTRFMKFNHSRFLQIMIMSSQVEFFEKRFDEIMNYLNLHNFEGLEPKNLKIHKEMRNGYDAYLNVRDNKEYNFDLEMPWSQSVVVLSDASDPGGRFMVLLDDGLRRTKGEKEGLFTRQMKEWKVPEVSALQYMNSFTNEMYRFFKEISAFAKKDWQPDVEQTFRHLWSDVETMRMYFNKFMSYATIIKTHQLSKHVFTNTNKLGQLNNELLLKQNKQQ